MFLKGHEYVMDMVPKLKKEKRNIMKVLKIKKVEASMDPEVSIHQIIVEVKILGKVNGNIQCGRELGAQLWGFRMWDS